MCYDTHTHTYTWALSAVNTVLLYINITPAHTHTQIHRQFRKPLIVFSPKNLLRHPKCKSPLAEFDDEPDDQVGDQGRREGGAAVLRRVSGAGLKTGRRKGHTIMSERGERGVRAACQPQTMTHTHTHTIAAAGHRGCSLQAAHHGRRRAAAQEPCAAPTTGAKRAAARSLHWQGAALCVFGVVCGHAHALCP